AAAPPVRKAILSLDSNCLGRKIRAAQQRTPYHAKRVRRSSAALRSITPADQARNDPRHPRLFVVPALAGLPRPPKGGTTNGLGRLKTCCVMLQKRDDA